MPNLADTKLRENFVCKLEAAEKLKAKGLTTQWEAEFVDSMREKFELRDAMLDLGVDPWNPSASQWNTLSEIAAQLGDGFRG
jgi:hypothetical protein